MDGENIGRVMEEEEGGWKCKGGWINGEESGECEGERK